MTYPRKTAAITACASAAGARTPHLTRPASARRPRNDASDTAEFDGDLSGEARATVAKQGFDRQCKHKRRNMT